MRIACSLGSVLSIREVLECAESVAGTDVEAIWIPETWGMESYAIQSAVASRTTRQKIGSSIVNVYSRSPATIAMGAATLDTISGKRALIGLGTSSVPIVEGLHGYRLSSPLQRTREYVEIIRLALSGQRIDYAGKIFNLRGFSLLARPPRQSIPIYLAAVNQKMVDLAWQIADGVIFYLRPKDEMARTISRMQSQRRIDVACQLITCVSEDPDMAERRAKKTLAFYVAVGRIYREFLAENGFAKEAGRILEEYKASGLGSLEDSVPDRMVEELCIAGTPDSCKRQLRRFRQTGMDMPIIQFNPVGDTKESFGLLRDALMRDG